MSVAPLNNAPAQAEMVQSEMVRAEMVLHQWVSPAFPVGAFSYSHGLERVIADGVIHDRATAQDWIATALTHGAGQSDGILLAAAWRAAPDDAARHAEIAELADALAPSAGRRREARAMGAAFARAVRDLHGLDAPDAPYPVVFGRAARAIGGDLSLALRLYLQAFVANLSSVAVRLVPLGQTDGQGIVFDLAPEIAAVAQRAEPGDMDQIGSSAIALDVASMRHETLETRLFRS